MIRASARKLYDRGCQIYLAFYFFKRFACYCWRLFILKQQRADTWTVKCTKRIDSIHDTSSWSIIEQKETPAIQRSCDNNEPTKKNNMRDNVDFFILSHDSGEMQL